MGMLVTPTPMTALNQLIPIGSPFYVQTIQTVTKPTTQARLHLWVWSGAIDARVNSEPDYVLVKDRISVNDRIIVFELSELIKPHLNPTVSITGQYQNESVWFYYDLFYYNTDSSVPELIREDSGTLRWATLGYSWNWEFQTAINGSAMPDGTTNTNFALSDNINGLKLQPMVNGVQYWNIKLNNLGATNNTQVIKRELYTPPLEDIECVDDPYAITYLNKCGLFETFISTGKVVVSNDINAETYTRTLRNPQSFRNSVTHLTRTYNQTSKGKYNINLGRISPELVSKVEEILVSPLIYIQNITSGERITVNVENTNFVRKTRLNDKNKITYAITFLETSNKIKTII